MKGVGLVKTTRQLSSRFFGLESRPSDTSAQTHLPAGWGGGVAEGQPPGSAPGLDEVVMFSGTTQHVCSQCFLGVLQSYLSPFPYHPQSPYRDSSSVRHQAGRVRLAQRCDQRHRSNARRPLSKVL